MSATTDSDDDSTELTVDDLASIDGISYSLAGRMFHDIEASSIGELKDAYESGDINSTVANRLEQIQEFDSNEGDSR